MSEEEKQPKEKQIPPSDLIPWAEFLEDYPINSEQVVSSYYESTEGTYPGPFQRLSPILRLYCPKCKGIRNFSGSWEHHRFFNRRDVVRDFLNYNCRDCEDSDKTFCVISYPIDEKGNGCAVKIGELPELHLELPRSVEKLICDDYSLFVKGLTCEKHGLGIGAFTYYRRVVESQKNHLISEILRVAEKLGAASDVTDKLNEALKEKQFSRAVDAIKEAIPESLKVDSHNPLKLLHGSLSICVHTESDETCLRIAHSIRLVLADFSERLKVARAEQGELRSAVSDLIKVSSETKKKAKESQK